MTIHQKKTEPLIFFVLLFLYQFVFIFQGLDVTDEGFHAAFYRWIFEDPRSVQFNFMYWFSGVVGGLWLKLFPSLGLIGLRLAGVLTTTFTILIAYNLLKPYTQKTTLRWGLFFVLVMISNHPKTLFYDNLCALFFMGIIWFLFHGLTKQKSVYLFAAGALVAVNIFSRVPNIVEAGLVLIIFFYGFIEKISWKKQLRYSVYFFAGIIVFAGLMIGLMKAMHQYDLFLGNLHVVKSMAASQENTHSLKSLVYRYVLDYGGAVITGIVLLAILIVYKIVSEKLKSHAPVKPGLIKIIRFGFLLGFSLLSVYAAYRDTRLWNLLLFVVAGLIFILGCYLIFCSQYSKETKLLLLLGIMMILILPVGSDGDLLSVGRYCLWIPVPLVLDYIYKINTVKNEIQIQADDRNYQFFLLFDGNTLGLFRKYSMGLAFFIGFCYAYFYPFFDNSNRIYMHYTVNNKYLHGIYTTQQRAAALNSLLAESGKYISQNDYVLAYDGLPMLHYITDTKPFIFNSWPAAYDSDMFKQELDSALKLYGKRPVVIQQKVNTVRSNWPQNVADNYLTLPKNEKRNKYLNDFLMANNYKMVWENDAFMIYLPPS